MKNLSWDERKESVARHACRPMPCRSLYVPENDEVAILAIRTKKASSDYLLHLIIDTCPCGYRTKVQLAHYIGIASVLCRVASRRVASRRVTLCLLHMPVVRRRKTTKYRDRRSNNPNYEDRIQEAIRGLLSGKYKSQQAASRDMKVNMSYSRPVQSTDLKLPRFP
jgi:hypothetical protein